MDDATRKELRRIYVDTIQDWNRVKSNFTDAGHERLDSLLAASKLLHQRDAIQAHLHKFIDSVFDIARRNLRVNGRNLELLNESEQETESFDEALDRHIWSLSDQRIKWDREIALKRRTDPRQVQSLLQDLFERQDIIDQEESSLKTDTFHEDDDQAASDDANISFETEGVFNSLSALSRGLSQVVPVQYERSERVRSVANEIIALKQ